MAYGNRTHDIAQAQVRTGCTLSLLGLAEERGEPMFDFNDDLRGMMTAAEVEDFLPTDDRPSEAAVTERARLAYEEAFWLAREKGVAWLESGAEDRAILRAHRAGVDAAFRAVDELIPDYGGTLDTVSLTWEYAD